MAGKTAQKTSRKAVFCLFFYGKVCPDFYKDITNRTDMLNMKYPSHVIDR